MAREDEGGQEPDGEDEGLSTPKKVVAGAALGVAIPAAVGAAKKLLGSGGEDAGDEARPETGRGGTRSQGRKPTPKRASTSRSRSGATASRAARSGGAARKKTSSSGSSSRSSSGGSRRGRAKSSSTSRSVKTKTTSSSRSRSAGPTRDQLYGQAKRLEVEGRSRMTKTQLERAVKRARGKS